jgi:hypothetical protein
MKVELPGESKSFADIEAGECFAFTRKHVSSVCMKVGPDYACVASPLYRTSQDHVRTHG